MSIDEWKDFIRKCCLSNEDIQDFLRISKEKCRQLRSGAWVPDNYPQIRFDLVVLELNRLKEDIAKFVSKFTNRTSNNEDSSVSRTGSGGREETGKRPTMPRARRSRSKK